MSEFELDLQSDKMVENWASPCTGISCLGIICCEKRSLYIWFSIIHITLGRAISAITHVYVCTDLVKS